jgi:hypothetical protein
MTLISWKKYRYHKEKHKSVFDANKKAGLEVNPEETKRMLISRVQNIVQKHIMKIANRFFEDLAKLRYLGTDQNCIHEGIKIRQNSGSACYDSVQSLLSSGLLSRNVEVEIYKTIILPVVLYGCETWVSHINGKHGLRVFETRVLRRIFGHKGDEVTGEWRKLHIGSFVISTHLQISVGKSNQGESDGRGVWHAWERREMCARFW